jgi:glycosyltransferase involved in cell wall biosynthesis
MKDSDTLPLGRPGRPRLFGVLVTYRRPTELRETLRQLARQDRQLDRIVVVDNAADGETEQIASAATSSATEIRYLPMPENLGFAGGVAAGMEHVLEAANDQDWIVVLDDDDPPSWTTVVGELERFALAMVARDPATASVGSHGARFDWRRARIMRVPDEELEGAVPVDWVGGNSVPFHRVAAIRDGGPYSRAVFFGLSEVEHGLRLGAAGYRAYAHGELWRRARVRYGRMGLVARPSLGLGEASWRRYYSLRNVIYILRSHGRRGAAIRATLVMGVGKPAANLVVAPRRALEHLRLNLRACRDGWTGRMGRTMEPHPWRRRPSKVPFGEVIEG